ncbi:glycosyltransferase family 39 protein [Brevundimonas sp. 2R-24]|uniref:Glycosyltransferase family 39 protein n=1 Tax=Peiella sedimenti TaxID=3061083 RepID=A0ABT8SH42_9CAUL|nr:glycosyltransferase family 39 protein [Caulobacteraceae bacterium XZ-24]
MTGTNPGFDIDEWIRGWRGPLLAALIAVLAGLPSLALLPPLDRDESRFAQATTQMLHTGDLVDIRFQDQPRHKKPVGIHWMQAAAVSLTTGPEAGAIWAYRLPSLLGAALAAFAAAWGAAALIGRREGFAAGVILGVTFLLSSEAGIAKTDAVLCGLVTLAMAALARMYVDQAGGRDPARRHKLIFWAAVAVAVLVKGPVGPLVPALALLALGLWDRRWGWMRHIGWGWGALLLIAIVGPWAVAVTVATDGAFWGTAIGGDLAPKLVGGHERHWGPPGQHLLLLPLLFFPAGLLLPAALTGAWRDRTEPVVRFALCWLIPTWIMFEAAPTKLWHYTLPAFGALAWLAARALFRPISKRLLIAGLIIGGFGALLVSAIAVYGLSEIGGEGAEAPAAMMIVFAVAALVLPALFLMRQMPWQALATAAVAGIIAHAGLAATARSLAPLWVSPRLAEAVAALPSAPTGPLAIAGYSEPSAVFLLGTATAFTDGAGAAQALAERRPVAVERAFEPAFRAEARRLGLSPRPAARIEGVNYSKGDPVDLTLYTPQPQ